MKRRRERNVSVKKENVYSGILYRANLPTVTERELTLADKKRAQEKKKAKLGKLMGLLQSAADKAGAFFARAKAGMRSFTRGYEAGGDNRKFYISVAASAAALIAITLVCTSGILEPPKTQITVNDTGRIVSADTRAKTVGEFLEKNQITLEEGDVLEIAAD
ncbi:MAG: ubiquitin-like domain-containing protein, partial [Clostridiales bacterium]|nr:ubiquitin-like domain-containing protein [Clostridiales bacterium]